MAAPTFVLSETNGAGATVSDSMTSIAFASVDLNSNTASLSVNNPIVVPGNSFEKWNRWKVTGVASNALSAFGVFFGTTPQDSSGSSANIAVKFATNAAYATPTASTSIVATTNCAGDQASPGTSLTAPANTVGSYTAYITQQLQALAGAIGGNMNFSSPWLTTSYSYS
jgi:hypothetical protein